MGRSRGLGLLGSRGGETGSANMSKVSADCRGGDFSVDKCFGVVGSGGVWMSSGRAIGFAGKGGVRASGDAGCSIGSVGAGNGGVCIRSGVVQCNGGVLIGSGELGICCNVFDATIRELGFSAY